MSILYSMTPTMVLEQHIILEIDFYMTNLMNLKQPQHLQSLRRLVTILSIGTTNHSRRDTLPLIRIGLRVQII